MPDDVFSGGHPPVTEQNAAMAESSPGADTAASRVASFAETLAVAEAQAQDGDAKHAPLPISYAAEDVARTFTELLPTLDFRGEIEELGVGLFKRGKARKRLTAISISLWHLALERSFPHDASAFAEHFAATSPLLANGKKKSVRVMREMVAAYDALLAEKKDADFTAVADDMASSLGSVGEDWRRHQLKLSLRIRALYEIIFKNLIPLESTLA